MRVLRFVRLVAALMLIPTRLLAGGIAPNLFDSLGMYFSVVALNTVWIVRAPLCQEKKPQWALWEGVCQTVWIFYLRIGGFGAAGMVGLWHFWGKFHCPFGEISGSSLGLLPVLLPLA